MSMADQDEATAAVVEGLKRLYHTKLKPLEQTYMFGWFHSPPLTDSEFESKPQVLMCGQYSTGKTSVSHVMGLSSLVGLLDLVVGVGCVVGPSSPQRRRRSCVIVVRVLYDVVLCTKLQAVLDRKTSVSGATSNRIIRCFDMTFSCP